MNNSIYVFNSLSYLLSFVFLPLSLSFLWYIFSHSSWALPAHISFLSIISPSPPRALAFLPSALVSWKQFLHHVFLIHYAIFFPVRDLNLLFIFPVIPRSPSLFLAVLPHLISSISFCCCWLIRRTKLD